MFDKQERNMLFPGQRFNFSSVGPDTSHFQNNDVTSSSYFIDMDIADEISKKRKFLSLDNIDSPGISSVICGNNQYYEKANFAVGQQTEFLSINKALLSNLRPTYFQQKEPSLYQETYMEEISNLRDFQHIGRVTQLEQSGYQSEYNCDLVSTFLLDHDKQQGGMIIPHLPGALESSSSELACLEREKLKNNAYVSNELESIYLGKQDALTNGHKFQFQGERSLCVNANLNSERFSGRSDGLSAIMDEQNKPTMRLSPVISEKIWEGSLKLNTSTTVSAVASFKSGAKVEDLNWPEHLEIKGKVRLHAFEKFIQELPRSRNRALMVMSLCWKLGSCQSSLAGMMEVAKGYRESEKVGFAQIPPGIDLYVCPRSDTIITILAKYGFFKGMAAVEEDQDSLIGCVVWRRGQSSTNSVSKTAAEGKKALIQEKPLKPAGLSSQGMNSPAMEARSSETNQVMPSETELKAGLDLPGSEAARDIAMDDTKSMITESKAEPSSSASTFHSSSTVQTITSSIPYSCPLVPTQPNTCERPSLNLLQEKMKPAGIIPLAQNSGTDKAVLVSDSWTQFVSPPQMTPGIALKNSLSSSTSQNLGRFGSGPGPGPRPLIPVDSSNFQFQPQLVQKPHSSLLGDGNVGSDSSCSVKNPAPTFQPSRPALPGPPPSPIELLQSLIQSQIKAPNSIINARMLHDEIHTMQQAARRGPTDVLETRAPSAQIQDDNDDDDDDDDDDLPEFDFNSACEEQPDAPKSRLPGCSQQTHFPYAEPPFNEKHSFEAANTKPFESFQHRKKPSPIPVRLLNSNQGLNLVKISGDNASKRKLSTEGIHLTHHLRYLKEEKDSSNVRRHDFGSEHKSIWNDDDDDMPEWCPPDLELPEFPRPSAAENARLPTGRSLPPPTLSIHPSRSQDLPKTSRAGLLGPCPSSDAPAGGFLRFAKPPLGSRRADSVRPHAGKFKSRRPPHYDSEPKRRRRHRR